MDRRALLALAFLLLPSARVGAQFQGGFGGRSQVGLSATPQQLLLGGGQAQPLAAYCGSLFDDTPSFRDRYLPERGAGSVTSQDGAQMDLREAVMAGLVAVRGRGPADPPRPPGAARGLWIDLFLANRTAAPLLARVPAGAVFQPEGHPRPVPAAAGLTATLEEAGLGGSDVACFAAWVATGSTTADIEHMLVRVLSEGEVSAIRDAIRAAGMRSAVQDGRDEYTALYQQALARCGGGPAVRQRGVRFPSGLAATLVVTRGANEQGVAEVQAKDGTVLRYAADVTGDAKGRWLMRLVHLKTGRPVPGLPQYALGEPQP